jgi:eukaryotic-like serine/threonine-protein kinase
LLYDGMPSRSGAEWFETACCHAALASLAKRGSSGASDSSEAKTAVALLAKAVAMDYRDPRPYRRDSALDPLRSTPDFRPILLDLAFPKDPFVRERDF